MVKKNSTHEELFDLKVKQVEDARLAYDAHAYKYYVTTGDTKYRFVIFCK